MKILVIDNYDSFTYNLVQLLGKFTQDIVVRRNDEVTVEEIKAMAPDKILLSPGPGRPEDARMTVTALKEFGGSVPILGVCLGHQAIGMVFGARVIHAPFLMHGKISGILHDGKTIFQGLEQNFPATRYHSLVIERGSLPAELEISAQTEDGIIMGVRHKEFAIEGIQFHPESILTTSGEHIIKNWIGRK